MGTITTARDNAYTALTVVPDVEVYRTRQSDYQFPCLVVGWPREYDVRAAHGGERDITLVVSVGVQILDDDSVDAELEDLMEQAIDALLEDDSWDILPDPGFAEQTLADDRRVVWADLSVRMLT